MVNNISGGNQINKIILNNAVKAPKEKEEQLQNNPKQTLAPFNSAYVTPFINQVSYTQNEKEFIAYRDKFCEVLKEVGTEYNKANWEFYINSTPENANTLNIIASMYDEIYGDKEAYEKFKEFEEKGINDSNLQKHLNQLLGNFSCDSSEETEETAPIEEENSSGEEGTYFVSENEISEVFNNFKPQIDGKEVSESDINEIFHNSKDIELRKKAYIAENSAGDAIADDLIQLVKQRNEEAKAYGYDNYYSMMLEQYGTSEEELFGLLDDLDKKTSKIYEKEIEQINKNVCDNFGITPEEIRPWHYRFRKEDSIFREADKYFTKENLVPIATEMYTKMGWPIDKMPITMDLFPRDNKNGHGFCFQVEAGKDARILANLDGDKYSMETLLHESGHAVYDIGLSTELPYLDRNPASSVMTEAVAMLMQSLPEREGIYAKQLDMPKELNDKLENERLTGLASFVKTYIFYSNFEKQLYENPDQDIKKLWFDLKQKYEGDNPPDELNNEWATVPHFLTHPGYLQNYLRAEVMAAQIYDAAHEQIGDLSETTQTAKFFQENIFKYGSSKTEDEIMKIATGKSLSAEAFCKQLEKIKYEEENNNSSKNA